MAKLKKNKEAEVNVDSPVAEVEEKNVTTTEAEAILSQQVAEEKAGASTEKMKRATALVSSKFNLDDTYHVTNFKDSNKTVNLTLENGDFILTVQIKDDDRHGLAFD